MFSKTNPFVVSAQTFLNSHAQWDQLKCLKHALAKKKKTHSKQLRERRTYRISESIAARTSCHGDESSVGSRGSREPQATEPAERRSSEGAIRRVGTCRHSRQTSSTIADEAVVCHVVHWLECPYFRRFRAASRKLTEFIQHQQRSLASQLRRIWLNPAPEDVNNILARWNKEEMAQATIGAAMVFVTFWTTRKDTRKLLGRAPAIPHSWSRASDYHDFLSPWQRATTPQNNLSSNHPRVTHILGEQQLSATQVVCLDDEELHDLFAVGIASWNMPGGLRKEPTPWTFPSCGVTRLKSNPSNCAKSGSLKEHSPKSRVGAPVCLLENHCGSPSSSSADARLGTLV